MEQITTSLFDGVSKEEYAAMTACFKATVKNYKKGEEIPMPEGRVGVVQRGKISVMRTDADGVRTIFEQLGKGGVFGAPIGYARSDAGYFLLADEDCDVLMIDARLGEAEYGLVAASLNYQKALHNFNILMGDSLSTASLPADSIMTAVALPTRIGHAEILDRRSDYTAAMLRTEQAAWDIRSARAKYLPQINLGATGTWQTRSPNSKWATTLDGMAYISLDIPVFHWGARNRTVAIARQAKEIRQFEAQQLRDRIFLEEADAWSAVQNSFQQTVTSYRSLETARENLQLSTYSYNEGQLSILDVLSAQLSWLQLYENASAAALGLHLSVADYNRITSSE